MIHQQIKTHRKHQMTPIPLSSEMTTPARSLLAGLKAPTMARAGGSMMLFQIRHWMKDMPRTGHLKAVRHLRVLLPMSVMMNEIHRLRLMEAIGVPAVGLGVGL